MQDIIKQISGEKERFLGVASAEENVFIKVRKYASNDKISLSDAWERYGRDIVSKLSFFSDVPELDEILYPSKKGKTKTLKRKMGNNR